jgi:hypothetical protein
MDLGEETQRTPRLVQDVANFDELMSKTSQR